MVSLYLKDIKDLIKKLVNQHNLILTYSEKTFFVMKKDITYLVMSNCPFNLLTKLVSSCDLN